MDRICSTENCGRPVYSKGVCKNCYERARRAKAAGPPASERRCAHCGELMVSRVHRDAMYCSVKCMQAAVNAARPPRRVPPFRLGLECRVCGGPVPAGRTVFCSRKCTVAWGNRVKDEAKRARWRAEPLYCQDPACGKQLPVPDSGYRRTKFCSDRCKKRFQAAVWRKRSPGYMRKYLYGVTPEQWQAAWDAQDGVCAICRSDKWPGKDNRPHTDHDPATNGFRGILCGNCNNGLGMFGEDPERIDAAAAYLRAFAARLEAHADAAVGAGGPGPGA